MNTLDDIRNLHIGETCFLLGNGPSINKVNFDLLKNESLFGVNRAYKLDIKLIGICVTDGAVWNDIREDLLSDTGDTPVYLALSDHRKIIHPNVINLNRKSNFQSDLRYGVRAGGSCIFAAMNIVWWMGFTTICLLGCDCDYSQGIHFDNSPLSSTPISWQKVFEKYKEAKIFFGSNGVEIYNCTDGGKLEVFRRLSVERCVARKNIRRTLL